MKKLFVVLSVVALLVVGCGLFQPSSEVGPDGKRKSLGRDLGGAAQMVIEGEWIAGGMAALAGLAAATGRYFFRRGEKAEKRKVVEIEEAVVKRVNGGPKPSDLELQSVDQPADKATATRASKPKRA